MRWVWAGGVFLVGLSAVNALAQQGGSEIFKCRGEGGQLTYTNDRRQAERQKCVAVTPQINVAPSAKPSPSGFPRETPRDKASAKDRQREILQSELSAEEAALTKARQELAQQESVRDGNEKNYARVQERLKPYQDSVEAHQKNIEALKREIANQYR